MPDSGSTGVECDLIRTPIGKSVMEAPSRCRSGHSPWRQPSPGGSRRLPRPRRRRTHLSVVGQPLRGPIAVSLISAVSCQPILVSLVMRCPLAGISVFSLGGEKLGPRIYIRVLLQQHATLAFGHAAPDTELHPVVECLGGTLGHDRTVPANHGRFSLRRSANEQFVGVSGATPRTRHPRVAGFARASYGSVCCSNHAAPPRPQSVP